jgi:hypothetical protein
MAKAGGRRSLADIHSAEFVSEIKPTRALSEAEAKVWNRAVGSWPADHWIQSDAELLSQYCAIVVLLDEAFKEKDVVKANSLGRLMLGYTRALRITCQSRYDPRGAGREAIRGRENEAGENHLLGGAAWEHLN